jgi:putative ABC transport system permease protein
MSGLCKVEMSTFMVTGGMHGLRRGLFGGAAVHSLGIRWRVRGLALSLSAIGIYGAMAYSVGSRTQEMGIRMSLGAEPRDILKLVVQQGMRLVLIGVAIGLAVSLALTRLIATLPFGVGASDPLAFTFAAVVLVATALAACHLPARRATRVNPIVVLRFE